jgi:hypothetical protein
MAYLTGVCVHRLCWQCWTPTPTTPRCRYCIKLTFLSLKLTFLNSVLYLQYPDQRAQAFPVDTPARYAVYPWVATVTQGYTAGVEGVARG